MINANGIHNIQFRFQLSLRIGTVIKTESKTNLVYLVMLLTIETNYKSIIHRLLSTISLKY